MSLFDWLTGDGRAPRGDAETYVRDYVDRVMQDPDAWYAVEPAPAYGAAVPPAGAKPGERMITFDSAIVTPHRENNTVYLRYFPAARRARANGHDAPRRAVLVMAQWNSDEGGHVGVCRMMAALGISAVRLSLPYHDRRMPPDLQRADYIVSSNVGQTLQVNRQAVLDARRAIAWLKQQDVMEESALRSKSKSTTMKHSSQSRFFHRVNGFRRNYAAEERNDPL